MPGTFDSGTFGAAFDLGQAASFASDETSIQGSRPIELYTFTFPNGTTYYRTSYHRDFVASFTVLGVTFFTTYSAGTIRRSTLVTVDSRDVPNFSIDVAITDPLVQAFIAHGVTPQSVRVTVSRYQRISGQTQHLKDGLVTECSLTGRTATFRIVDILEDQFSQQLPSVALSRACNHVLYDLLCRALRSNNQVPTALTAVGADFRSIAIGSLGAFGADPSAFVLGDLVHQLTGERRTIVAQTGTQLVLDVRLPNGAAIGDAVTIARGCKHDANTCRDKFANMDNYGGHPAMQSTNFMWNNILRIG